MVGVNHNARRWLVGEILMVWMMEVFEASISWRFQWTRQIDTRKFNAISFLVLLSVCFLRILKQLCEQLWKNAPILVFKFLPQSKHSIMPCALGKEQKTQYYILRTSIREMMNVSRDLKSSQSSMFDMWCASRKLEGIV